MKRVFISLIILVIVLFSRICFGATCYGIEDLNPSVCNGHGTCGTDGACDCASSWAGKDCYYYESGRYQYIPSSVIVNHVSKTWDEANDMCRSKYDAHLTSIESKTENDIVAGLVHQMNPGSVAWIGGTDRGSEGVYRWESGSSWVYMNWLPGEPTGPGQDCLVILSSSKKWLDQPCEIPISYVCRRYLCGMRYSGNVEVCSGHGNCYAPGPCVCASGYFGQNCEYATCSGIIGSDPTACNGHGKCIEAELCECENGYGGAYCSATTCYGIDSSNPDSCSGNGVCSGPDACSCFSGYIGDECETHTCASLEYFSSSVCSGRGRCTGPDQCVCDAYGYSGENCEKRMCHGLLYDDPKTCSSKGNCTAVDTCSCEQNYSGDKCQNTVCGGVSSTSDLVCSSHGECVAFDLCKCEKGYTGDNCQYPVCYDLYASDTYSVCTGHGVCVATDRCLCSSGYAGDECEIASCYGKWSNNTGVVCGGENKGKCISVDACECNYGYSGAQCQDVSCFGISNSSLMVCSGNGVCSDIDECRCNYGYRGDQCLEHSCYGVPSSSISVCNGNGRCDSPDLCTCEVGYTGSNCSVPVCYGKNAEDPDACSSRGKCVSPDTCDCQHSMYSGVECEKPLCFGSLSNHSCSGHGACTDADLCLCDYGYTGSECEIHTCFGVPYQNIGQACSGGRGVCVHVDTCICSNGYSGSQCSYSNCRSQDGYSGLSDPQGTVYYNTYEIENNDLSIGCGNESVCYDADICICPSRYYYVRNLSCDIRITSLFKNEYGENASPYDVCRLLEQKYHENSTLLTNGTIVETCLNGTIYRTHDHLPTSFVFNNDTLLYYWAVANASVINESGDYLNNATCYLSLNNTLIYPSPIPSYCDIQECFGKNASDVNVCSGKGYCRSRDDCVCRIGYHGNDCQYPSCYNIPSSSASVCSGNGLCVDTNHCVCGSGYVGERCQYPKCYGELSVNIEKACNGHGHCHSPDTCSCSAGYFGEDCSLFTCNGVVHSNHSHVCSSRGTCVDMDTCICEDGFSGADCASVIECTETMREEDWQYRYGSDGDGSFYNYISSLNSTFYSMVESNNGDRFVHCSLLRPILRENITRELAVSSDRANSSEFSCRDFHFYSPDVLKRPLVRYDASIEEVLSGKCSICRDIHSNYSSCAYSEPRDPKARTPSPFCDVSASHSDKQIHDSLNLFASIQDSIDYCSNMRFEKRVVIVPERYDVTIRYNKTFTKYVTSNSSRFVYSYEHTAMVYQKVPMVFNVSYVFLRKLPQKMFDYRSIRLIDSAYNSSSILPSGAFSGYGATDRENCADMGAHSIYGFCSYRPNTSFHPVSKNNQGLPVIRGMGHLFNSHNTTVSSIVFERDVSLPYEQHREIIRIGSKGVYFRMDSCELRDSVQNSNTSSPGIVYSMCGVHYNSTFEEVHGGSGVYIEDKMRSLVVQYYSALYNTFYRLKRGSTQYSYNFVFTRNKVYLRTRALLVHYDPVQNEMSRVDDACPHDSSYFDMLSLGSSSVFSHSILIKNNMFSGACSLPVYIGHLVEEYSMSMVSKGSNGNGSLLRGCKCVPIENVHVLDNTVDACYSHEQKFGSIRIYFSASAIPHPAYLPLSAYPSRTPYSISNVILESNTLRNQGVEPIRIHCSSISIIVTENDITYSSSTIASTVGALNLLPQWVSDKSLITVRNELSRHGAFAVTSIYIIENVFHVNASCIQGNNCVRASIFIGSITSSNTAFLDVRDNRYESSTATTVSENSGWENAIIISADSNSTVFNLLKWTYGQAGIEPTGHSSYQILPWNYRIRNMMLPGNMYDVLIDVPYPATGSSFVTERCNHVCKRLCNACIVDPTRESSSTSGYCFGLTRFSSFSESVFTCRHNIVEVYPVRYPKQITTISISPVLIRRSTENLAPGPLFSNSGLTLTSKPLIEHGDPLTSTIYDNQPHPIYLHSSDITIEDIRFEITTTQISESYANILFSRDTAKPYPPFNAKIIIRRCEFSGSGFIKDIFDPESMDGWVGRVVMENNHIDNTGIGNVPPNPFQLVFSHNVFTRMSMGVIDVSPRVGFFFHNNSGTSVEASYQSNAVIRIRDSKCTDLSIGGCVLSNNYFEGAINTALLPVYDIKNPPKEEQYGDSTVYALERIDMNKSSIYGNGQKGAPYMLLYKNITGAPCSADTSYGLKSRNVGLVGVIQDICCDKGWDSEYCCRGACSPPRPDPLYCLVDPSVSDSDPDYLYSKFKKLSEALYYCQSSPVMTIYIRNGAVVLEHSGAVLSISQNNERQTGVLVTTTNNGGVMPLDVNNVSPKIVTNSIIVTPQFSSNITIDGIIFSQTQIYSSVSEGHFNSILSGTTSQIVIQNCEFIAMESCGHGSAFSLSNYPVSKSLIDIQALSSVSILSNRLCGAYGIAIRVYDYSPARTSSSSPSPFVEISGNTGSHFKTGFVHLSGLLRIEMNDNVCKLYCGAVLGMGVQYAAVVSILFRNGGTTILDRVSLSVNRNHIAITDSNAQRYGNPMTLRGGYFSAMSIQAFSSSIQGASNIDRIDEFRIRDNRLEGYPVGMRVSDIADQIMVMNEPPFHSVLKYDSKRSIREMAVLNTFDGTVYDIINGAPSVDIVHGSENSCNDFCLPGGGLYCLVSREYNSTTEGYGITRFSTVRDALLLCSRTNMMIQIGDASYTKTQPSGLTIHCEDVDFSHSSKQITLDGTLQIPRFGNRYSVLVGRHSISAVQTGLSIRNLIMVPYLPACGAMISDDPSVRKSMLYTSDQFPVTNGSVLISNVYAAVSSIYPELDHVENRRPYSFFDISLSSANSITVTDTRIGTLASPQYGAPLMKATFAHTHGPSCGSFSFERNIVDSYCSNALSVFNSSDIRVNGNIVSNCTGDGSASCLYFRSCRNQSSGIFSIWNNTVHAQQPVQYLSHYSVSTVRYSAIWIDDDYTQNSMSASSPVPARYTSIYNNSATGSPVGIRLNGWRLGYLNYSSGIDNRMPVRTVSALNMNISSSIEDVMIGALDKNIEDTPFETKPYYCSQGCPSIDSSYPLQIIFYVSIGVAIFVLVWCWCFNGWTCFCRHSYNRSRFRFSRGRSSRETRALLKKSLQDKLQYEKNRINKEKSSFLDVLKRKRTIGLGSSVRDISLLDTYASSDEDEYVEVVRGDKLAKRKENKRKKNISKTDNRCIVA